MKALRNNAGPEWTGSFTIVVEPTREQVKATTAILLPFNVKQYVVNRVPLWLNCTLGCP